MTNRNVSSRSDAVVDEPSGIDTKRLLARIAEYWKRLGLTDEALIASLSEDCLSRARRLARRATPGEVLRRALEDEVLSCADSGELDAMRAASDFAHDGFRLADFWEVDCRKYTVQFLWSLYAISWAIQQYDRRDGAKSAAA